MSFTKDLSKTAGNSVSKDSSGKFSQKHFDHAKKTATDAIKTTSKRLVQNLKLNW